MPDTLAFVPTGLQLFFEQAQAEGGQLINGQMRLPPSLGTGFVQHLAPEPGLGLNIFRCHLTRELTLPRPADATQPETLLFGFNSFANQGSGTAPPQLSSVQITSSDIGFTSVLPANMDIFLLGIAVQKELLLSWLNPADGPPPAILTTRQPVVLDTLLTPEIEWVLAQLAELRTTHYLDAFFYKIKMQELLYFLFQELARREATPARHLHTADVQQLYQVRAALLASLGTPPSVPALAQAAGLSETKLKQLFRQIFGTSPYDYYQRARLEEAKRLLRSQTVSEVGYQLGFTNLSHFARLFEKHHGLTPKKYQATHLR
ncbi:MAG: helix-turn-helix transcriptional regulator [Janthinobacterium lividum]